MFKAFLDLAIDTVDIGVSAVKIITEPVIDTVEDAAEVALEVGEDFVDMLRSMIE